MSLHQKICEMEKKLDELYEEENIIYSKDRRLELFALISQFITFVGIFFDKSILFSFIVIFFAGIKAEEITIENQEEYFNEIINLCHKIERENSVLLDMYYDTCDLVEEILTPLKEEALYLLKNRNYSELLDNYTRYEDVLILLEDGGYYHLLWVIIELGRNGITFSKLSSEEKRFLEFMNYNAENLEKVCGTKEHESLGMKVRKLNEEYIKQKTEESSKVFKKKR